ncbi:MAG: hypothetical protein JNL22_05065 [Bacteroidales bacterium]|nr:hypothetical protein [Bacteroidales bacterium]
MNKQHIRLNVVECRPQTDGFSGEMGFFTLRPPLSSGQAFGAEVLNAGQPTYNGMPGMEFVDQLANFIDHVTPLRGWGIGCDSAELSTLRPSGAEV